MQLADFLVMPGNVDDGLQIPERSRVSTMDPLNQERRQL